MYKSIQNSKEIKLLLLLLLLKCKWTISTSTTSKQPLWVFILADTPPPPRADIPQGRHPSPPAYTPRRPLQWTVHIVLEFILVEPSVSVYTEEKIA